jgi:hypothetical protein
MGNQTAIRRLGLVAEVLQLAPQEPSQPGMVQPIGVQPTIGSHTTEGVEVHMSETKWKAGQHAIHRTETISKSK